MPISCSKTRNSRFAHFFSHKMNCIPRRRLKTSREQYPTALGDLDLVQGIAFVGRSELSGCFDGPNSPNSGAILLNLSLNCRAIIPISARNTFSWDGNSYKLPRK